MTPLEKELFAALLSLRAETGDLITPTVAGGRHLFLQAQSRKQVERRVDRLIQKISKALNAKGERE